MAKRLFERSEGHPLFLAQLFAAPGERGEELPATLRHRIESLLAAKGEDAVAVACALALEPDADVEMLVGALRIDEDRVLDAFDDLLAAGIVREGKAHAWAFDHDTTAEVAAHMLRAPRRHALHERFAGELAERSEPDVSLRRARHLLAAGKRVDAARAFFASSEEAIELHAMLAAIERAGAGVEAIDAVEGSDENYVLRANLYISQARAALELTDWSAATQFASHAVRAAELARNDERLAYALHLRAGANHASWNVGAALVDYERAAILVETPKTARQRAIVGHEISAARRLQGDLAGSIEEAERSLELVRAKRREDPNLADTLGVNLQMSKALALATAWRFEEAERCFADSAQDAVQVGGACAMHWHESRAQVRVVAQDFAGAREDCSAIGGLLAEAEHQRRSISHHGPMLGHVRYSMNVLPASIAAIQGTFELVEPALVAAEAVHVFENAPVERRLLAILRAEVVLASGSSDRAMLERFLAEIPDVDALVGMKSFSMTPRLTHARLLVRLGDARAAQMLEKAWATVWADAQRTPLRCDDAFASLGAAAEEYGDAALAGRAREAAVEYRARRLKAAAF